ncbi:MAG: hypothetical protein QM771_19415 [Nitrospira sp.]
MKCVLRDKTMFRTAFSPSPEVARRGLNDVEFCFDMSSFQEMSVETVNHYLAFMARTLKAGGTLLSVNLETSRYRERNSLNNFDFSLYHSAPRMHPALSGTDLAGHIPGLRMAHAEVVRRADNA